MFARIAVVNRGESAVRLVRAVRELNAEHGYGIASIALHTEAERRAMFVRNADEAFVLRASSRARTPYLDHMELARALRECRADAAWVGWGFVAEDPEFAELCRRLGVAFIGPPAEAMRRLGDKIAAKQLAEQVGVPVAAWSGGPVDSLDDARRHAEAIGYPLVVKARGGGGGRGIRLVRDEDALTDAFERTRSEAAAAFGDPVVFMERMVTGCRHVEVQVIADQHGTVLAPGVRDCSIQRRQQKLIEESTSPLLTAEQARTLKAASAALIKAAGYEGAGTVEYLYQPAEQMFTFLEVNTRLQVEHPITEITTGMDLVKYQILVAAGLPLPAEPPEEAGHAIEARLNAEDADNGFAPAPGAVALLRLPGGPGIRVDTGIASGDVIPPEYDSMVAKVIAWGQDRPEALARLRCALRDTTVVLRGGTSTKSLLLALLDRPELVDATADTQWLDRVGVESVMGALPDGDVALLAVAVDVYLDEQQRERERFLASARGGRPRAQHSLRHAVELRYQGVHYSLEVAQVGPYRFRVRVNGNKLDVDVDRFGEFLSRLVVGGHIFQVVMVVGPDSHVVDIGGVSYRIRRDEAGVVRAAAPGVVVALRVRPGDAVAAGDTVAVLESMKMETPVTVDYAGRVRELLVPVNSQVDAGAPLLQLDPDTGDEEGADTSGVSFDRPRPTGEDSRTVALERLAELRALMTGYDVSETEARALVAAYLAERPPPGEGTGPLLHEEIALLRVFADLCELSRNRPTSDEERPDDPVHSPREHLHTFLRSLDADREGMPDEFRVKLTRMLQHYGVTDLTPGPELEEAVYRLFIAQERISAQVPVAAALLQQWLRDGRVLADDPEIADILPRLVVAAQRRSPVVGDLARSVRYQLFDEPVILANRERVHNQMRAHLAYLADHPDAPDRAERIDWLVRAPEPALPLLGEQMESGGTSVGPMLEVLTRRNYRTRVLEGLTIFERDGREFVTAAFDHSGERRRLIQCVSDFDGLRAAALAVSQVATAARYDEHIVVDLYLSWEPPDDPDEMAAALQTVANEMPLPGSTRRVTFAIINKVGDRLSHLTFRPQATDGPRQFVEDQLYRGVHPLIGQRLDLWRLENFEITRLPSAEDVHLYRAVARENRQDERLVAFTLVRDVTPTRDETGQATGMPAVERILAACTDSMRRARAERPSRRSLDANQIFLLVRPTIRLTPDELVTMAKIVLPITVGVGLDEIMLLGRLEPPGFEGRDVALRFSYQAGAGVRLGISDPPTEPVPPIDEYAQNARRARSRGNVYPYELIPLLTGLHGRFVEHDLDEASGTLVPVDRPPGRNTAGLVVGVVTTRTERYPEGMTRVVMMGDPTKALGSVAAPECARVCASLDLAEELGVPVEWFALSSGARISMDSGTENMDWVARALRRIITFTQAGHEINVVVAGINVGAQPYWNAEATMLMHTKGILVMTPDSAMVLTGKQSLDYSGGVSAEDNFGLGGYDRVMGPNGQAQYWAPDLSAACDVLFAHYEHAYVAPGERFPRRALTKDPFGRDVRTSPHVHPSSDFTTVGDIFSPAANPERKKPFDIRTVMGAVVDQDHTTLERWARMAAGDTAVVLDVHLGGFPCTMIGIESHPVPRRGRLPADGPDQWTAGTLFPRSSKKVARAINAASGNRPLVVLANLSGFDGSPESLRRLQLEYGAEIGRAVVNFDGPIVFCVISRYHGGAFVVFSGALNESMEVVAVEGSYASVIGGAPAAAVVFTADVNKRTAADPRVRDVEARLAAADEADRAPLRVLLSETRDVVRAEKLGEVASEFESIHTIERARSTNSVHAIISADRLRPYLIAAVERGVANVDPRAARPLKS